MNDILWQPYFPLSLTLGLALVALVCVVIAFWRGAAGSWGKAVLLLLMRVGTIVGMTLLLMGPSRIPEASPDADARRAVTLLLDSSGSMLTEDMEELSRWEFALKHWLNPGMFRKLSENGTLSLRTFDSAVQAVDAASLLNTGTNGVFGSETRMISSLETVLDERQDLQDIILVSDGHDSLETSASSLIARAKDKGVRIHSVPLGGPRLERDLHVVGVLQQPYLIAKEKGVLRVRILQVNARGEMTTLRVTHQGQTQNFPIRFTDESYVNVDIPLLHEEPGAYAYMLQVDPLKGEIEQRNNHQTLFVDVTPERFRVLLLEGQPFWDSKFIAQSLRRDGRLELMQVSQIAQGRRETLLTRIDPDKGRFPETLEDLVAFDVVILGKNIEKIAGEEWLRLLPDYVNRLGGKILFARGRAFDPDSISDPELLRNLKRLEPVALQEGWRKDLQFTPTAAGAAHPVLRIASTPGEAVNLFQNLTPVPYIRESVSLPGSRVLAEFVDGSERWPGLAVQDTGSGKTMMMLGEGTWRWRMPRAGQQGLKGVYESIWTHAVRWMLASGDFMPGADWALRVTPRHLKIKEALTVSISTRIADARSFPKGIQLISPDGSRQYIAFDEEDRQGLWADIALIPEKTGVYRVEVDAPGLEPEKIQTLFNVYDANVERLQSGARPGILKMISRETGGAHLDPYRPELLPEFLAKSIAVKKSQLPPEPIWDQGWILFGLLMLVGSEWMLRRRWGWR